MASMSVMDERPPDAAQHVAPLSSVNGPARAPPMSPMRWQIEPPPLAPGAGAQWLIAALVALGPFSLTMYQPALPSIASSLNITTAQVQLTLTVYLASFAIGQLIYGPMSDQFRPASDFAVGSRC